MIKLHVTKKLLAKLPADEAGFLPLDDRPNSAEASLSAEKLSPLSGWHGNLITLQRRNCILLVHDETRFPLFIPCLTKPDFAQLDWLFMDILMNSLLKMGANNEQLDAVQQHLAPLQIDTDCTRSVQGTMNRMKGDIEHMLHYDQANITGISGPRTSIWLADRPCNVKGQKECVWPNKAMLDLLSAIAAMDHSSVSEQCNVIRLRDYRNQL